jgi:hypothetical protein
MPNSFSAIASHIPFNRLSPYLNPHSLLLDTFERLLGHLLSVILQTRSCRTDSLASYHSQ